MRESPTGRSKTPEFWVWWALHQRCENPAVPNYHNYGGRGIAVCARWGRFSTFIADMGRRPSPKHQLDRRDNEGPYSPDNCRWVTKSEQMLNTRVVNRLGDLRGAPACASALGLSLRTYFRRKAQGQIAHATYTATE